jgi:flagellar motor switch protein FliN
MTNSRPIDLQIELGRAHLDPAEVRQLRPGTVISLDSLAAAPVDIHAGGRLVARGETVVHDGCVAVRVVEIVALSAVHGRQKCVA